MQRSAGPGLQDQLTNAKKSRGTKRIRFQEPEGAAARDADDDDEGGAGGDDDAQDWNEARKARRERQRSMMSGKVSASRWGWRCPPRRTARR
jgi:hypothetical protein